MTIPQVIIPDEVQRMAERNRLPGETVSHAIARAVAIAFCHKPTKPLLSWVEVVDSQEVAHV